MSVNDFTIFGISIIMGLTTLWGLFVAMKFYIFLKKLFNFRLNQSQKMKMIFLIKDEFDCQAFDFESTLENLSL